MVSYLNQVAAEDLIRRAILAPFSAIDKRSLITPEHPLLSMMPLASLQSRVQEVFAPTRFPDELKLITSITKVASTPTSAQHAPSNQDDR
jgi:hypothetical protein